MRLLRIVPDDTKFDFMRFRRISFPLSAALSIVAMLLYFFHGQGQDAEGMVAAGLILWGFMKESSRPDRIAEGKTDLQRAIMVFVDGECHGDECYTGNFYADFEGLPRQDRNFESAFYELVRHVDATYRTKQPALVDE